MDIFKNPDEVIKEVEEDEDRREAQVDVEKEADKSEDGETDQGED